MGGVDFDQDFVCAECAGERERGSTEGAPNDLEAVTPIVTIPYERSSPMIEIEQKVEMALQGRDVEISNYNDDNNNNNYNNNDNNNEMKD